MLKSRFFFILAASLLVVSSCGRSGWWDARLSELDSLRPGAGQAVLVRAGKGSSAKVQFYVRGPQGWTFEAGGDAFIGRNGVGKAREGDARTPSGVFGTGTAFGRDPDPGTGMAYLQLHPGIIACDCEGQWYNCIVDTVGTGLKITGEDMYSLSPEYDLGLEIAYNEDRVWPLGSAIFLHCKGAKSWTGGCVAVDKDLMRTILLRSDGSLAICIR